MRDVDVDVNVCVCMREWLRGVSSRTFVKIGNCVCVCE